MRRFLFSILGCAALLTGCSTLPDLSQTPPPAEETKKQVAQLVAQSVQAHGQVTRPIEVSYEGTWAPIIHRLQPVLVDREYRKNSVETWTPGTRTLRQVHTGPAGEKIVERTPKTIRVWRNGKQMSDPEELAAAALVADAYSLFLLGTPYLVDRKATFFPAPADKIDGKSFPRVLAVLRPGFGLSPEDRVLLTLDPATGLLHSVYFSINGLGSTQGAEVEVFYRDYDSADGLAWATNYYERVRRPLRIPAHRWKMISHRRN